MVEAFPKVVQAELDRIGQNQRWLAAQLDISHVSVSNWLSGRRRPSAQNIEAVARAFGRSASWLYEQMEMGPTASPPPAAAPTAEDPDPRHAERVMTLEDHEEALNRNACEACHGTGFKSGEAA